MLHLGQGLVECIIGLDAGIIELHRQGVYAGRMLLEQLV